MMKVTSYLTILLFGFMATVVAHAGKPGSETSSGEVFYVEFLGPTTGSAFSNPTENRGNIQNLVFNKDASEVQFNLDPAVFGDCFAQGDYGATMQLYEGYLDGLGGDPGLTARFWFNAGGISYVLELFDTVFETPPGPDWSGDFPPFDGVTIYRTAESWAIRTTSKKSVKGACTGVGDFGSSVNVAFALELAS